VPMVDAITALRNCALWSDSDNVPCVAAIAIECLPDGCSIPVRNRLNGSLSVMLQSGWEDRKVHLAEGSRLLQRRRMCEGV
jgi:hypothetical protein